MSRPMPYVPMHEKRDEVSQERMAEILAKHTNGKVEINGSSGVESVTDTQADEITGDSILPCGSSATDPAQGNGTDSGSRAPPAASLQWEKPEENSRLLYSTCKRYRVFKTCYGEARDVNKIWKYRVEKLVADTWYYKLSGDLDSFKDARAVAEADLKVVG